jgi:hypothetical protein
MESQWMQTGRILSQVCPSWEKVQPRYSKNDPQSGQEFITESVFADLSSAMIACARGLALYSASFFVGGGLVLFFRLICWTQHCSWTGFPTSSTFVVSSSINSLQMEQIGNSDLKARFERNGMDWAP